MIDAANHLTSLQEFLRAHPKLVVLSGAGISKGSGIPTYRDSEGNWRANEPIKHQEFVADKSRRQRYWARSLRGWPGVRDAQPNDAHRAVARLEHSGHVQQLITQNVDRLHQRAGSSRVVDLHGRLDRVVCLKCNTYSERETVQQRLQHDNPEAMTTNGEVRPDGDSDVPDSVVRDFKTPHCLNCGGVLMPDVVFFGGTVPRARVDQCMAAIDQCDALLVVGSSLQVYSGFRFCRRATERQKPIALINPGQTRADSLAALRLETHCAPLLSALVESLPGPNTMAPSATTPAAGSYSSDIRSR
ncbi:MAG: NAD-dependent protein deacetylase [Halieaceae bacterium]